MIDHKKKKKRLRKRCTRTFGGTESSDQGEDGAGGFAVVSVRHLDVVEADCLQRGGGQQTRAAVGGERCLQQ